MTDAHVPAKPFQKRVKPWMDACFGAEISGDKLERSHRFLEETLELVQACDCPVEDARALVEYVYSRPVGERRQEIGGVMVTLAALCLAHNDDMHESGEAELARVWTKVEAIRAKQAAKPRGSALPQQWPPEQRDAHTPERIEPQPVSITYRNWRGEVARRTITPQKLWFGATEWHPEPQWLLSAFDHGKQAMRDFALSDIGATPDRAASPEVVEAPSSLAAETDACDYAEYYEHLLKCPPDHEGGLEVADSRRADAALAAMEGE